MSSHHFDLTFRVLVSKEDDEYIAHALEIDLVGTGTTPEEAQKDLKESILCQITFAAQHNDSGLLGHAAPPDYFERWEKAQHGALMAAASPDKCQTWKCQAAVIEISPRQIRHANRRTFKPQMACA